MKSVKSKVIEYSEQGAGKGEEGGGVKERRKKTTGKMGRCGGEEE